KLTQIRIIFRVLFQKTPDRLPTTAALKLSLPENYGYDRSTGDSLYGMKIGHAGPRDLRDVTNDSCRSNRPAHSASAEWISAGRIQSQVRPDRPYRVQPSRSAQRGSCVKRSLEAHECGRSTCHWRSARF